MNGNFSSPTAPPNPCSNKTDKQVQKQHRFDYHYVKLGQTYAHMPMEMTLCSSFEQHLLRLECIYPRMLCAG